ncbi:hypothetical protein D5018_00010 [Parashewanella curva]|uniref:Uncharacterized protein n=1 Tax=Parashewanella curva TaxID=2338552 RepID=A0A3L8Q3B2_9GAMM|nr:hypothetical protein [Parashewanella curva]RLV61543.1 hypothetical protein D5018_00010 [Parashewanella curva]
MSLELSQELAQCLPPSLEAINQEVAEQLFNKKSANKFTMEGSGKTYVLTNWVFGGRPCYINEDALNSSKSRAWAVVKLLTQKGEARLIESAVMHQGIKPVGNSFYVFKMPQGTSSQAQEGYFHYETNYSVLSSELKAVLKNSVQAEAVSVDEYDALKQPFRCPFTNKITAREDTISLTLNGATTTCSRLGFRRFILLGENYQGLQFEKQDL